VRLWHNPCFFRGNTRESLVKLMNRRKTILFADDDQVLLAAYCLPLQNAGYNVITVHDGLETLKKLFLLVPDLLILDLMMPSLEGEDLLKFISSRHQVAKVPVIILSSKSAIGVHDVPLINLAAKYLIKQECNPSILLEAVRDQFASESQEIPARIVSTFELN